MQYILEFSPKASAEFEEAAGWYERSKENLGETFTKRVTERLSLIQQYPNRYRKIKGDYRQTSVRGFPYCIVYFTVLKNKIVVVSIFHHKRNPKSKFR